MLDSNQVWGVDEAIAYMGELADFNPTWIEEPTARDDVLGFVKIARALEKIRHRGCYGRTGALPRYLQAANHEQCDPILSDRCDTVRRSQ